MTLWRQLQTEERKGEIVSEVGRAAVRLNSDQRDTRGLSRRSRREWLRGGKGREAKDKEIGAE